MKAAKFDAYDAAYDGAFCAAVARCFLGLCAVHSRCKAPSLEPGALGVQVVARLYRSDQFRRNLTGIYGERAMLSRCTVATMVVAGFVGGASQAVAQEAPKWTDIDCAQSKIVGPTGLRCRATQEYSGGNALNAKAGPGGTFRHWAEIGTVNGSKLYYFLKEATSTRSSILPISLEQTVKDFGGSGATNFSTASPTSGGDYLRFVNRSGENCIAVRKVGPSSANGNKWYLMAIKCAPKAQTIPDTEPALFLATANAPNAGY